MWKRLQTKSRFKEARRAATTAVHETKRNENEMPSARKTRNSNGRQSDEPSHLRRSTKTKKNAKSHPFSDHAAVAAASAADDDDDLVGRAEDDARDWLELLGLATYRHHTGDGEDGNGVVPGRGSPRR